jgi:hypothetical protein
MRISHAAGDISNSPLRVTGASALNADVNLAFGTNQQRGTPNERFLSRAKKLAWK